MHCNTTIVVIYSMLSHTWKLFISEVTSTTPLTPTTDSPTAVTQQLQSSASLDGSVSSSASAVFEPIKSDPSECELHVAELFWASFSLSEMELCKVTQKVKMLRQSLVPYKAIGLTSPTQWYKYYIGLFHFPQMNVNSYHLNTDYIAAMFLVVSL